MNRALDDRVYLKQDVRVEPLACRWSAWTHLVSPVQHALNIARRQLPLLRSFLDETSIHFMAAENPDLFCGPFVHVGRADIPTIRGLIEQTEATCSRLIRFASDLQQLDRLVQKHATGTSLSQIYMHIPSSLSGIVELMYDLNNRPQFRILEELVEEAGLRNDFTQEIVFSASRQDHDEFFLNTPRLDRDSRVFARAPFTAPIFDTLSSSRINPVRFSELADSLNIPSAQMPGFRAMFSDHAPTRVAPSYDGDQVRLRYFGHACVLVQTARVSILIDPCVAWSRDSAEARLTFADLPDFIDYVFITHNHPDHFCPEVLLQLRGRIGNILVPRNNPESIVDPSMRGILYRLGLHQTKILDTLESVEIPDGYVTSIPFFGEHSDLNVYSKHAMFVQLRGRRLLFVSDSACLDRMLYRRLASRIGGLDALFIGMECHGAPLTWLYGPYLSNPLRPEQDESRRLSGSDCEQALALVEELRTSRAFVYAMGQEPWLKYLVGLQYKPDSPQIVQSDEFVRRCRSLGIQSERLYGCHELFV
jgi:hypothetical protein